MDPFALIHEGENALRNRLLSLTRDELAAISKAYQLNVRVSRHPDVGEIEEAVDLMVQVVSRRARAA